MSEHSSSGGAMLADLNENAVDDQPIDDLFDYERRQIINAGNLDGHADFREESITWILKARESFCFSPLTAHVAVAYFDWFLSRTAVPVAEFQRLGALLPIACLATAAKVEEVRQIIPEEKSLNRLLVKHMERCVPGPGIPASMVVNHMELCVPRIPASMVLEMESEVYAKLKPLIRRITAFHFEEYFVKRLPPRQLPRPADHVAVDFTDLVKKTIRGDFVRFLPSEVAAAAVILVTGRNVALPDAFYERVDKVRVTSCRQQLERYLPGLCSCVDCVAPPATPVPVHDSVVPIAGDTGNGGAREGPFKKWRLTI